MRIRKKIKNLFNTQLIDKLPENSTIEEFFKDGELDYRLLQKDLIESHLQAFKYYQLLLQRALETGCTENINTANRGLISHSREINRLSGLEYFSNINAAAAKLEAEGYSIIDVP